MVILKKFYVTFIFVSARRNATGRSLRHGSPLCLVHGPVVCAPVHHLRRDDGPTREIRRGNIQQRISERRLRRIGSGHSPYWLEIVSRVDPLCADAERRDDDQTADKDGRGRERNPVPPANARPKIPVKLVQGLGEGSRPGPGLLLRTLCRHLDHPWHRHLWSTPWNRPQIHCGLNPDVFDSRCPRFKLVLYPAWNQYQVAIADLEPESEESSE